MDAASLLSRVELFSALDPEGVAAVAAATRPCTMQRNDLVFAEGDRADDLYIVREGRIAITIRSQDGRESVVALMERDDLFGEMPFFDGEGRSADARALEPAELLAVPYQALRDVLEERPKLLWKVTELMARRLRATDAALADSMFLDVTGRTAKRLVELSADADEFVLPVTQEELAGMVGASRERVNKAISAFIRLGWIEQSDRRYRILDREQLTRRAH
ncbi:MAG: family transcriptional regulator, cyclic receptor protein [Actinomycetota bacterium]|nr:family transcriptional regulator, cyclic receptor protein [Actinomycetota bacterium]